MTDLHSPESEAASARRTRWTFRELYDADIPHDSQRVEGMLAAEGFAVLLGAPKSGKSLLLTQLAHCLASGAPFLGLPVQPTSVLLLEQEGGFAPLRDRV